VITGEGIYFFLEKQQAIQEMTHYGLPMFVGRVRFSVTRRFCCILSGYSNPTYAANLRIFIF
jgi:hypothetical protein